MLGALTPVEALRSIGGFDVKLHAGEDLDLFLRLKSRGYRIEVNPKAKIYHIMPVELSSILTRAYRHSYYYSRHHGGALIPSLIKSIREAIIALYIAFYCFRLFRDSSCILIPFLQILEEIGINFA